MGWNDRMIDNPYPPYESYTEQDHYAAYLDYLEQCRQESGISSQNVDPATLTTNLQERPASRALLSRLWSSIFGEEVSKNQQESNNRRKQEDADVPF